MRNTDNKTDALILIGGVHGWRYIYIDPQALILFHVLPFIVHPDSVTCSGLGTILDVSMGCDLPFCSVLHCGKLVPEFMPAHLTQATLSCCPLEVQDCREDKC